MNYTLVPFLVSVAKWVEGLSGIGLGKWGKINSVFSM